MRNLAKVELLTVEWAALIGLLRLLSDGRRGEWVAEVLLRLAGLIEEQLKDHYKDNQE